MTTPKAISEARLGAASGIGSPAYTGGPSEPGHESSGLALLALLRRRFWFIALCAIIVASAAFVFSSSRANVYESTASLLFRESPLDEQLTGFSGESERFNTVEQEAATNVALVSTKTTATQTATALGKGYDVRDIQEDVTVSARKATKVVDVTATASDAAEAARIANAYARSFIESRVREQQTILRGALERLEAGYNAMAPSARDGQPGVDLRERISTLRILEAVQSPNVALIQPADEPRFPVAPRPKRDALLGGLFGLLLGFGLAVLREQTDRTIRSIEGLEAGARAPLLGIVPHHRSLAQSTPAMELPPDVLEAFRLIQANLRYAHMRTDCLVVSSAAPGEGKTVCSWYLASATASTNGSTLLIEADLRRRSVAERYDLLSAPGLSSVLMNQVTLAEAVQEVPVARRTPDDEERAPNLDVLTAGPAVADPGDLIDSAEMHALLSEAQARYDVVIIDTPPISHVADAIPTMTRVGGVVLVGRVGVTNRRELERLRSRLEQLRVPVVGIIANDDQSLIPYYGEAPS